MKIFLILLTAFILRLINLNQSLWLDEAINVVYSQKYSLIDFLTVYSLGDFHPPLHFGILWIWTRVFGTSEIAVRIPSLIFGLLTVWFTYLIGKNLFGKNIGLIAALILAFNPLHTYYSQEARMYSLAALSVTFSFWAFINLLKDKRYSFLLYSLSVVLVLYSDYLAYLAIAAQFIYVVWLERKKIGKFTSTAIAGGMFLVPWLFIFPSQLKTGQAAAFAVPGWANIVGGASLKELGLLAVKSIIGRVSFVDKFLYIAVVIPILSLYGFIAYRALKNLSKEAKLIAVWILIPIILALLISFYIPIFAYFRMIYILPATAILLGLGIKKFDGKIQKLLLLLILINSLVSLLVYYFNPKFQREDWKNAVNFANKSGSLILFEDSNIPSPAQYYDCGQNCFPALKSFPAKSESDLNDIMLLTSDASELYLFDYLVEISDPDRLVKRKLESLGFKNTETKNFNGVGFVYKYSK